MVTDTKYKYAAAQTFAQVLTLGTAKCWNKGLAGLTLLACWTVRMGGEEPDWFRALSTFSSYRFVLKGAAYNPMDVMNCLMIRRGYKMQGDPQQRNLPNIHNKDDK